MKRVILAALVAFVLVVSPAFANKIKPTLSVDPAAPVAPQAIVLEGCGYVAEEGVTVVLHAPGYVAFAGDLADIGGCISVPNFDVEIAGEYSAEAFQSNPHHADAVLDFSVS